VWSSSLGQPLAHIGDKSNGSAVCVAFHPDGLQVLAGFHSGHLRLYDITTGMVISGGCGHVFRSTVVVCELFDFVRVLMHLVSYCGIWLKCASKHLVSYCGIWLKCARKHDVVSKMIHDEALVFTAQIEKSSIVCG